MKISVLVHVFLISAVSTTASADVAEDFKAVLRHRKGPFTVNILQHPQGRTSLGETTPDGCIRISPPSGRRQFQAAFRNALAQRLAEQDFYVGNLFTTNYYLLTGEYVFGNPCDSHPDDHAGLLNQSVKAMPKAASMARHWVLEKYYIERFPNSPLTRAFKMRGISDTENEADYAVFFFNFYLSAMTTEAQFLPAYLLVKVSPVGKSSSIDRARILMAEAYDFIRNRFCPAVVDTCSDPRVFRFYQLRNAVHNQLSPDIINEIDKYYKDFAFYLQENHTYLGLVQEILRAYYSFNAQKIVEQAQKSNFKEVRTAAEQIVAQGVTVDNLLALSVAGAGLRSHVSAPVLDRKSDALVTVSLIAQFIGKEIEGMKGIQSKNIVQALLNTVYMEGFLIKSNWQYFASEINKAADIASALRQLGDVVKIAQVTLDQSFDPALKQWAAIEPQMRSFIDNVIKSSSLNSVSIISDKQKNRILK